MTHFPDEPCPFAADNNPTGMLSSCCSLRGKIAACELAALGQTALMELMHEDLSAEVAITFAKALRDACDRLESEHQNDAEKLKGAGWNGILDSKTKQWVWRSHSTFEEAIAAIRQAAYWYDKVGKRGFGVHAWY